MSAVNPEDSIETSLMEDAGTEAVNRHAAKSQSDKAEVATINIHSVLAALSALANIKPAPKREYNHDISKDALVLTDPSSSSSCEGLREALARAHLAKDIILAQHRARIADTFRIRPLLATLPPLFIEKMPVPSCPPLKKFGLFESLPKEVRIMIYELMIAEPRCIKLFEGHRPGDQHIHPWNSNVEGQSRHPTIMHICQEARHEGLRAARNMENGGVAMGEQDGFALKGFRTHTSSTSSWITSIMANRNLLRPRTKLLERMTSTLQLMFFSRSNTFTSDHAMRKHKRGFEPSLSLRFGPPLCFDISF
ncbi:hypothetical protein IFR04_001476 [Cadophora malorum]|uniref:2EXR domain-containing protein n=1 Tax=Cadophora malorum TaxID=108018 RepID=A0A8H7WIG0_9HELO|nr:hypothetical protein IFR04_001476 [Cadophora malorum]